MILRVKRRVVVVTMIIYIAALLYIVFLEPTRSAGEHYAPPRWMPLKSTYDFIVEAGHSIRHWLFFLLNLLGNIILFMPFGFLGDALSGTPANKFRVVITAFFFSLCIEVLQLTFMIGVFDADDIVLNTLGAYLGLYTYRLLVKKDVVLVYNNS
ncbi:VanZ family protein [Chitinophaga filiformis]|uniref:VanZ family protein n=1 Tax=Chitinophaga filiformis TaxID=104663 RepID=UPI001F38B3F6|nr:VanZ family protein [Chitinophaga filiformis]MCF6402785.1 VanZ family protein [Chitinophaga filiformis]MCF6403297.1 VanZ family protein [Chitinophaga filiformis]